MKDRDPEISLNKGRHKNTQQRMTKDDKSLLVSLQNMAFF